MYGSGADILDKGHSALKLLIHIDPLRLLVAIALHESASRRPEWCC